MSSKELFCTDCMTNVEHPHALDTMHKVLHVSIFPAYRELAEAQKTITITTVEELDALPPWTYVQGHDGFKHVKHISKKWLICIAQDTEPHDSSSIELPARVLYWGNNA